MPEFKLKFRIKRPFLQKGEIELSPKFRPLIENWDGSDPLEGKVVIEHQEFSATFSEIITEEKIVKKRVRKELPPKEKYLRHEGCILLVGHIVSHQEEKVPLKIYYSPGVQKSIYIRS